MRTLFIEPIGLIQLKKSARAKRLIFRFNNRSQPTVMIPRHIPYILAEQYTKKHLEWFIKNQPPQNPVLDNGMAVGKHYSLFFIPSPTITRVTSRVTNSKITITYPLSVPLTDIELQNMAYNACVRALKREAEAILPTHLHQLARTYQKTYAAVSVKNMHTRWGSCSHQKNINLSIWLIQLPDDLIEYVLCHELAHLDHPHHQLAFWQAVGEMVPDFQARRKQLRMYRPGILLQS